MKKNNNRIIDDRQKNNRLSNSQLLKNFCLHNKNWGIRSSGFVNISLPQVRWYLIHAVIQKFDICINIRDSRFLLCYANKVLM